MSRPRIVSLLPSCTEIACALGFGDALVGRSHECDFPVGVEALPVLTEAQLDASAPSRAIDDRVKDLLQRGLSVYRVDAEALRALAPDVILTQTHCEVCAASRSDVEAALGGWVGTQPKLVSLSPADLGGVWDSFGVVADALGAPQRGRELVAETSGRISDLGERAGTAAAIHGRPRVACIEWIDPLMAAGNWMPELVHVAGGESVAGVAGQHSPWLDFDSLASSDPDAIVILPCGFDLSRTRGELTALSQRADFRALRAVRSGRCALADGHQFFNRPGPRLVESLAILCEILHPTHFEPLHRGRGWEPLD